MNGYGIIVAVICFICIGLFHPIVIKAEYYWTDRCWPVFLIAGILLLIASLFIGEKLLSVILGIIGCSCLWSILEIKEQKERVEKGWFPENPNRKKS
ncbi:conserved hypothetical protein, putative membrane protein [Lachnospiraceae bacterium KM106-2]|nr:conserved hypothetical protein, putative membrane protein [Lachnospiraceae bacterium KM106-2]